MKNQNLKNISPELIWKFSAFFILVTGLWLMPGAAAEEIPPAAVTEEQPLETLRQNWITARTQYREALKIEKDHIAGKIKAVEFAMDEEADKQGRKRMMAEMKRLIKEHEEVNDNIRVISAGDVVQLSNTKNKIVAFLTHQ